VGCVRAEAGAVSPSVALLWRKGFDPDIMEEMRGVEHEHEAR
jgi:hypothetical protein